MYYRDPHTGKVYTNNGACLWTLLFGGFYFLYKGMWKAAFLSLILSALSYGLAWPVIAFVSNVLVENFYLGKGYRPVG